MTAIWEFVNGLFGTVTTILTLLTPIFILVSGLISLFFGRKFFWVFVAALGFLLGLYVSTYILPLLPPVVEPYLEFVRLALALTCAGLALMVQRAGTMLVGAVATGLLAWWAAGHWEITGWAQWTLAATGGLMGLVLLYFALDWALLVLTSLAGGLITLTGMGQLNGLPQNAGPWLYLVLVVAGALYQRRELAQDRPLRVAAPAPAPAAPKPAKAPKAKRSRKVAAESEAAAPAAMVVTVGTPVPAPVAPLPATTLPQPKAQPAPVPQPVAQPTPQTTGVPKRFIPVPLTRAGVQTSDASAAAAEAAPKAKRHLPSFNFNLKLFKRSSGKPLPESQLQPLEEQPAPTAKPAATAPSATYMGTSTGGINYAPAPKPTYQVYG